MSGTLTVTSDAFKDGDPIPEKYAFCAPCAEEHSKMSTNISPALTWSAGPEGTKSYAIICVDVDVPTIFDNINTEGKTIPADQPRQDFFHGLLVDVSANRTNLAEGEESGGLVAKGKPIGRVPHGVRRLPEPGELDKCAAGGAVQGLGGSFAGRDDTCVKCV